MAANTGISMGFGAAAVGMGLTALWKPANKYCLAHDQHKLSNYSIILRPCMVKCREKNISFMKARPLFVLLTAILPA